MPGDPWLPSIVVQANAAARLSERPVMEAVDPATVWGFHLSVFVEFSLEPSIDSYSKEVSPLNTCLVGPSLTTSIFEGPET